MKNKPPRSVGQLKKALATAADYVVDQTLERLMNGDITINIGIEGRLALIQDKIRRWFKVTGVNRYDISDNEIVELVSDALCLFLYMDIFHDSEPEDVIEHETFISDGELDDDSLKETTRDGEEETKSEAFS